MGHGSRVGRLGRLERRRGRRQGRLALARHAPARLRPSAGVRARQALEGTCNYQVELDYLVHDACSLALGLLPVKDI